jgi:transposase
MSDTELLPKSEPVRRLEVFTGAGRRRRWTAEQKARIVAETYAPEASVSAVARRHGLTPQQLFAWRRASRERSGAGTGGAEPGFAFASVVVAAPPLSASAARPLARPDIRMIEIAIGAMTVRVPPGADVATLLAVLDAVKAIS